MKTHRLYAVIALVLFAVTGLALGLHGKPVERIDLTHNSRVLERPVLALVPTVTPSYPIATLDGSLDSSGGGVVVVDQFGHAGALLFSDANAGQVLAIGNSGQPGFSAPTIILDAGDAALGALVEMNDAGFLQAVPWTAANYGQAVLITDAGVTYGPVTWISALSCPFTTSTSVTANGFYTICGAPWQMTNYTFVPSAWATGDTGAGLNASCSGSGTYGRTDPTLSVRFEDVIPNFTVAQPVRVTMCFSNWSPGSSNGGIHTFSQNVWDAGTCAWGTQQNLDYNHVSGNEALFVDEEGARGCTSWPCNLTTLTYTTAFGTGPACLRKTYGAGLQGAMIAEVASGVTTPPAYPGAWQSYGWVQSGNYLFTSNGSGAWNPSAASGAAQYADPTWYSTGFGMYCVGANSVRFTYFSVEYKN